jgi:hypothetical protein
MEASTTTKVGSITVVPADEVERYVRRHLNRAVQS